MSIGNLRSERLAGEPLQPGQEDEIAILMRDPRVGRTLWPHRDAPSLAEIASGLRACAGHWEIHGFGIWLLRDRRTGEFVGRGGLEYVHVAGERAVQAAWAFVPERWGEGLATELARNAVRAGFDGLGLEQIVAFTLAENHASRRVMDKAGFSYEKDIRYKGLPHVLYRQVSAPPARSRHNASAAAADRLS